MSLSMIMLTCSGLLPPLSSSRVDSSPSPASFASSENVEKDTDNMAHANSWAARKSLLPWLLCGWWTPYCCEPESPAAADTPLSLLSLSPPPPQDHAIVVPGQNINKVSTQQLEGHSMTCPATACTNLLPLSLILPRLFLGPHLCLEGGLKGGRTLPPLPLGLQLSQLFSLLLSFQWLLHGLELCKLSGVGTSHLWSWLTVCA